MVTGADGRYRSGGREGGGTTSEEDLRGGREGGQRKAREVVCEDSSWLLLWRVRRRAVRTSEEVRRGRSVRRVRHPLAGPLGERRGGLVREGPEGPGV